jgi:hypothetical protein
MLDLSNAYLSTWQVRNTLSDERYFQNILTRILITIRHSGIQWTHEQCDSCKRMLTTDGCHTSTSLTLVLWNRYLWFSASVSPPPFLPRVLTPLQWMVNIPARTNAEHPGIVCTTFMAATKNTAWYCVHPWAITTFSIAALRKQAIEYD